MRVIWAKEWLKTIESNPTIPTHEGTMIGWFANSIMAGYDEAQRQNGDYITELEGKIARAKESLTAAEDIPWVEGGRSHPLEAIIDAALKELQ